MTGQAADFMQNQRCGGLTRVRGLDAYFLGLIFGYVLLPTAGCGGDGIEGRHWGAWAPVRETTIHDEDPDEDEYMMRKNQREVLLRYHHYRHYFRFSLLL